MTFVAQFHFTRFLLLATVFSGSAEGPLGPRIRKLHSESHISDGRKTSCFDTHDVPNRSHECSGTFSSQRRQRNLEVHDRAHGQLIIGEDKNAGRTDIACITLGLMSCLARKFPRENDQSS